MQTMHMCNRVWTYTDGHWTRDCVKNIKALTLEQWIGCNLMNYHHTEGSIVLKTKEELARELDQLVDTDIHNIADKNR